MKIIDKTPLQNEKGEIGPLERVQGTLKYGFSWYAELEAQKGVIVQLERALEKGYVLIRNFTLPGIEAIEPIILVGPPGMYVIYVTPLTGFYEAKGDQWNTVHNGRSTSASDNLIRRVTRLAKALQIYLERQGVNLPSPVEPVLIASNPALHVDSMRPVARVVMSDAVKQFSVSLLQARPVLQTELVHDLADRIINNPRPVAHRPAPQVLPPIQAPQVATGESASSGPSRAQAIFRASEEIKPLDPNDLGFAFEEAPVDAFTPHQAAPTPARPQPAQSAKPASSGVKAWQWIFLAIVLVLECGIVAGFGYLILFANH